MAYREKTEESLGDGLIEDLKKEGKLVISKGITRGDVEGLRMDPIYKTRKTTIKANYIVEKIPVPSVNNITILSSSSNIFNKSTTTDNYVNSIGVSTKLLITGDVGSHYIIVVKDITNNKYYNWRTEEFQHGYGEKMGNIGDGSRAELSIPPQSSETTYNIFFKPTGATIYNSVLPTESTPWVINQLADVITTFRFQDNKGYTSDQTTTKTHYPGIVLNSGSINDGKIDVTITTLFLRGAITLISSTVKTDDIFTYSDEVEIIDSYLIASVDSTSTIGTITGSITLGKSSIRDTDILLDPTQFFIKT